jgi:hypothetical protein
MDSLRQKLIDLDSILVKTSAPLVQLLNPGLLKEEIIAFFQEHNIKPHLTLVTLYEWHNGVKSVYGHHDEEVDLIPFGALFNLHEMIQMREVFREWAENDFEDLDNYLPFMGTGESDMFILNLTTGEVLAYQPMIQIDGELAFHSIETLFSCILECFQNEAYQVDQQKGILIDMDKYHAIKERYLSLAIDQTNNSST